MKLIAHIKLLNFLKYFFVFAGINDIHLPREKCFSPKNVLIKIQYVIGTIYLIYVISGIIAVIIKSAREDSTVHDSILAAAEGAPLCIIGLLAIAKSYRILKMHDKIVFFFQEFDEIKSYLRTPADVKIVNQTMKPSNTFGYTYALVWIGTSLTFTSFAIWVMIYNKVIEGSTDYILPYMVWYPFDYSKSLMRWSTLYLTHLYVGLFVATTVAVNDCLFALMVTCIVAYLKILCKMLNSLPNEDESIISVTYKLQVAVDLHNRLIRLCKLVEDVFGLNILLNLIGSSMMICIHLFAITISPFHLTVKFASFIVSVMVELLIFSVYGETLIFQSSMVSDAIYNSPWTNCEGIEALHIKRAIILIGVRSDRHLKISAYGFVDMSMLAFTRIIKASFSYFALLRALYQK